MKTIFKRLCLWIALVFGITAEGQVPNPAGPIPLVQTVPLTNAIYGRIGITNMMLLVRGDNVIGDGGGGVFAWLHGDTNTADNARYFAATNGGNWYKISYWDDGTGGGGGGGGLGTNAFVNGVLFQPIMFTNNLSSDVGRLMWYTNANGHVVGYATNVASATTPSYVAAASSGQITNAYFQATTDIFYNVSGTNIQAYLVTEAVEDLIGASLVAGSNITISYDDGGTGKTTISGISSGATNGTPVSVDSGGTLVAANFTDTTGINFGVSGTTVTANLTDRDWGDITTSSSGTSVAINANSVTLGTDTTGNYIATIAGTANEVDASGSGSETAGVIVSLPATIDLGGKTSFEVPNAAAPTVDAFGEVAGDNDAWAAGRGALLFYDGTAATRLVGVLASDTPSNGQVPKWNTGGTITWEDDNSSGGGSGGGLGTNFVLNGVLLQPATITNGLSVIWSTNANGHAVAAVSLVETNIPSTIARLDSPTFTGTVTFDTLVANTLQVPFASRYAAANSSSNLVATSDGASWTNLNGSSVATGTVADARIDSALARLASPTFTGDPKVPTASPGDNDTSAASTAFVTAAVTAGGGGGGGGSGTNVFVNNVLSQPAKFTNSPTLIWTTNASGDILGTITNVAGSTTSDVMQRTGWGLFSSGASSIANVATNGVVQSITHQAGDSMTEMVVSVVLTARSSTNYLVTIEVYNTNDLDTEGPAFVNISDKTTTGFKIQASSASSGAQPNGFWFRVWIAETTTVGGSGGDVTQSGDNTFTGENTFSGTTTFSDLAIGTITVVTNLTVPNNAYGAGWNGSTNVPNENSVYDEMELRAPKASPVFTGSATFTSLSASLINSRPYYNQDNGDFWADGFNRSSAANAFLPNLSGSAVASGSVSGVLISTNNPVAWTLASSTTTNSGYFYWNGHASTFDISGGGDELTFILAISNTNKIQGAWGFIDDFTHTESVDGAYIRMDKGFIHGVIANNSSYTRTTTSNQLAIASTTFHRYIIRVSEDASYVTFFDLSPSGTGYTTNWTASVTNTLPSGSTRATSIGIVAINRDTPSAISLLSLDAVGKHNDRILQR